MLIIVSLSVLQVSFQMNYIFFNEVEELLIFVFNLLLLLNTRFFLQLRDGALLIVKHSKDDHFL